MKNVHLQAAPGAVNENTTRRRLDGLKRLLVSGDTRSCASCEHKQNTNNSVADPSHYDILSKEMIMMFLLQQINA